MRKKAEELLSGARATSDYVFNQLEEVKKQRDSERLGEKLAEAKKSVRQRVRDYENNINPVTSAPVDDDYVLPRELKKGDRVAHKTLGTQGTLLDNPDKSGSVNVSMGAIKMRISVNDLRLIESGESEAKAAARRQSNIRTAVTKNFKPECDVRGMIGDEAWFVVDRYLDDAIVAGIRSVTIIHGKGTGALRTALWNHFKSDSRVKSYRPGQFGEGDYGVTIVEM